MFASPHGSLDQVTTYLALLRGINLGPRNKVRMADLRELVESLGHENVRTHILSGNVLSETRRRNGHRLQRELEKAINERFGLDIAVLVRTRDDLEQIVRKNPLPQAATEGARLFVLFLSENPSRDRISEINAEAYKPEEFAVGDRAIYAWFRQGLQGSRLAGALSDKRLGVTVTNRNWNTVTKVLELADRSG
jgi:uncharacterized protein (DUF1697 family)